MALRTPRMVLGDDVGLGKTLEAIVALTYIKASQPETKALVLTEKVAFRQWENEFKWLAPKIKVLRITADSHPDPATRVRAFRQHGADVIITSYGMIYNYRNHILEGLQPRWVFIADEPNYFKTTTTKLHAGTFEMVNGKKGAARAYGLTATIVENKLEEAFGILRVIAPGTIGSLVEFEKKYCIKRKIKMGRRITIGYKNLDQFRKQIEPAFYGRLQDDPEVEQDLPEVLSKDVEITLGKEQSWKLLEATDRIIEMPDGTTKQVDILPALILSQQLANDPRLLGFKIEGEKMNALLETIEHSLAGERVMVFSKLRSQIDMLEKFLNKAGHETVRITGREKQSTREEAQERFMSDGRNRCNILLMTRAGQKALNLQKGGHLFFFDLPWSYGMYRQTIGRLKRTGSTHKKIGVYRMLATLHPEVAKEVGGSDQTIDHYSLKVIMKKFQLWQAITGDEKEISTSPSDLTEIWNEVKQSWRKSK